jgi:hypothetical protein
MFAFFGKQISAKFPDNNPYVYEAKMAEEGFFGRLKSIKTNWQGRMYSDANKNSGEDDIN